MIGEKWEAWYRALKARDPEVYRRTIDCMEAVTLNHSVPQKAAAEYERSAVMLACDLLNVRLEIKP